MDTLTDMNAALSDRYVIERELGHGGMATVYLAEDVRHHRKVAIKVLRPELAAVIGADRFVREIQTIATLQHPHILGLIDSGELEGTAYYVMPFVEGESLRDRLSREQQLPVDDAVRIAGEVASALDYAHRHGVIHRDIKPENIMLHDGSALVTDFGIALAVSSAGARMTETGMSLGTPHYMSPEQAMGSRELGPRSDVYALGCVLYEMLIGEPPFTGPTAQAIVARVVTESPRAIAVQRKSVPPHVEAATMKALEKLPADRFGTAREFADALSGRAMLPAIGAGAVAAPSASIANTSRRAVAIAVGGAVVIGTLAYFAGSRFGGAPDATPQWTGELLGGPQTALGARLSPDGQTLAFQAMVDGQTQIGVLKPASGDWTVLTHDRSQGIGHEIAWARDGSRIYYSRFFEVPRGIWSISPVGGDERLVLENAGNPEPLPDGSLLVSRLNAQRRLQLFHFFPENGRLDTLDASSGFNWNGLSFRAAPDGKRVVYWGRGARDTVDALRIMNIADQTVRVVARNSAFYGHPSDSYRALLFGAAFSPDGRWVVVPQIVGNLLQYLALAADGSGRQRVLFNATSGEQAGFDVGPDGSLYVEETHRPTEAHRFAVAGGQISRVEIDNGESTILPLPDGRFLFAVAATGSGHVMVYASQKEPTRFVQTDEPTSSPMARLGRDKVVLFVLGADRKVVMATASIATGRVVKRFPAAPASAGALPKVAGSPDGRTIFFSRDDGYVWARDVATGTDRRISRGADVASSPDGKYIVVERVDSSVRLVRVPLDGSPEQEVPVRGDIRPAPGGLGPSAISPDGHIAIEVISPASWFWPAAVLDPTTGKVEFTASGLSYDMAPSWADDGTLVSSAFPLLSRLWRLEPVGPTKWWQ